MITNLLGMREYFQVLLLTCGLLLIGLFAPGPVASEETFSTVPSPSSSTTLQTPKLAAVVQKLAALQTGTASPHSLLRQVEILSYRQQIDEAVVISALEMVEVLSKIDNEIIANQNIKAVLASKKGKIASINNLTSTIGNGTFSLLSAGLGPYGSLVRLSANSVSSGINRISARTNGKEKSSRLLLNSNNRSMLAMFLDPNANQDRDYPENIQTYFNDFLPNDPKETRKTALLEKWTTENLIGQLTEANVHIKMKELANTASNNYIVTDKLIDNRIRMLVDIRKEVLAMHQELLKIMNGNSKNPLLREEGR